MHLYTLTVRDLTEILQNSARNLWKHLRGGASPLPFRRAQTVESWTGREMHFRLSDVVTRLRQERKWSLVGAELFAVVKRDALKRGATGPDVDLGDKAPERAIALRAALGPECPTRFRSAQQFTTAELQRLAHVEDRFRPALLHVLWMRAPAGAVEALTRLLPLHPAILRYVLAADPAELPTDEESWREWVWQFAARNLNRGAVAA